MNLEILSSEQLRQLNEIFIAIVNKYRNQTSTSVLMETVPRLTTKDAEDLADLELGDRRTKINQEYDERVENINRNAIARRMAHSTVVLTQLDKALERRTDALKRLDNQKEKLAKRIFTENQRIFLSAERERSIARSRSIRDMANVTRMRQTVPYNAQALIDEELYTSYLAWLMQYPPTLAHHYVNQNSVFFMNMGALPWVRLVEEIRRRAGIL